MSRATDAQLAHVGLRLVLGINLFVHGAVRVPELGTFADGIVAAFADTILPATAVRAFALAIPFVEVVLGAAILVGFRLRAVLFASLVWIGALTFGTCLRQDWSNAGLQLVYALGLWVLLFRATDARWAIGQRDSHPLSK